GVARIPLGAKGVDSVGSLALQPDGKLVIATTVDSGSTVVRLTQSGDLDVTFAVGGKVKTTDPGAAGVVVDDGAIRVGGGGGLETGVMCDDPSGPLIQGYLFVRSGDESGNVGGRVDTLATGKCIEPSFSSGAVGSAGAGRVLVLGTEYGAYGTFTPPDAVVVAFGSNALDTSFAGNGILSTRAVADDLAVKAGGQAGEVRVSFQYPVRFAVDPESVVLLVDFVTDSPDPDASVLGLKLLRYDSTGQLDPLFGTNGIADLLEDSDLN